MYGSYETRFRIRFVKDMIISFDIDNTLIPYGSVFPLEEKPLRAKILGAEGIRKGCKHLFARLEAAGHQIYIYTTSYRSKFQLWNTFACHGLYPEKFINESMNRRVLNQASCTASKNPNLFGIDLHVDDSLGVEAEGNQLGFTTVIVDPEDLQWVDKVLKALALTN